MKSKGVNNCGEHEGFGGECLSKEELRELWLAYYEVKVYHYVYNCWHHKNFWLYSCRINTKQGLTDYCPDEDGIPTSILQFLSSIQQMLSPHARKFPFT